MKNIYIINGCYTYLEDNLAPGVHPSDEHWIPWVKEELKKEGVRVETPDMPNPWEPDYEAYKKEFEKYEVNEDTILVGHSCGCAFLVRWLGETKRKVAKLILVAPWKVYDTGDILREKFYNYQIDWTIKDRVGEIVMFTADDEEKPGKDSLKIFHDILGGKVIELKNHGHYTLGDMQTREFPELLEIILK